MEAAKSGAGGAGQRHRGRGPALYHRPWSPVSGAGTSGVHRPGGGALVRAGGPRGGGGRAGAPAAAARRYIIGLGPLFPVPAHPVFIGPAGLLSCVLVGLAAGGLSALLTLAVYAAEDAFRLLPIHWMWWPAIGGLAIGLGGL